MFSEIDSTRADLSRHCEIIRSVAEQRLGNPAALRMIVAMVWGSREPEVRFNPELIAVTREVLLDADLDALIRSHDGDLERALRVSLSSPREVFVRQFCERLRNLLCVRDSSTLAHLGTRDLNLPRLFDQLVRASSRAVLDAFFINVPDADAYLWHRLFAGCRGLMNLDIQTLRDWLDDAPNERALRIADLSGFDLGLGSRGAFPCDCYRALLDASDAPERIFERLAAPTPSLSWYANGWPKKREQLAACFGTYPNDAVQRSANEFIDELDSDSQEYDQRQTQETQRFEHWSEEGRAYVSSTHPPPDIPAPAHPRGVPWHRHRAGHLRDDHRAPRRQHSDRKSKPP